MCQVVFVFCQCVNDSIAVVELPPIQSNPSKMGSPDRTKGCAGGVNRQAVKRKGCNTGIHTFGAWLPPPCPGEPDPPVIFLDVDGVLHPLHGRTLFLAGPLAQLKRVVDASGCDIVVSSTWRETAGGMKEVCARLTEVGLPPPIDKTPVLRGRSRADEIVKWLSRHPKVQAWIAIDDMPLEAPSVNVTAGRHVKTFSEKGFVKGKADEALRALAEQGVTIQK